MKFTTAQAVYDKAGGNRAGLAPWTYNSAELTQLEIDQIFLRNWMWIGHVSDIPRVGDYKCLDVGHERAVVIHDESGEVRAFHNLCRHRGSRVVEGDKGHCGKSITCPFHGWSYHLDGSLKNIPRADTFPDIDQTKIGLKPVECEVWNGLIFIRFGGDGASVADIYATAEAEIGLYNIDQMQPLEENWRFDYDLDWKSVLDIDNEGYHVPIGHPELFDLVGPTYKDEVLECGLIRATGSFADRKFKKPLIRNYVETLPESTYLPESHQSSWIYWGMFPGFVITLCPDLIEVYQVYPTGYHKSVMAGACYALNDERPEMQQARKLNREINMSVGEEDVNLVKWSAEGMRSSAFEGAIMSDLELGVCEFHNQLRETLPVVGLDEAPADGSLSAANQALLDDKA
ncbi:MAG: phenylpropionate dioxygenase-like ring-hydroxylating dioxygenase large terminal subunit [Gammaproteobacteria bacterium]|jgi:phenylpropionate dioxygenase-like ring-hydroxylating dioxygenase large terminal subunit